MNFPNNIVALNEVGTVIADARFIRPSMNGSGSARTVHLAPEAWASLAMLTPEEHELLTPYESVRADFIDDPDTPGLYRFLDMMDRVGMGQSVDLMVWLRRWRA